LSNLIYDILVIVRVLDWIDTGHPPDIIIYYLCAAQVGAMDLWEVQMDPKGTQLISSC
jgi:hypothetical protein